MKGNLSPLLKKAGGLIMENLPTLAARGAVVGAIGSVVLMHKADKKAYDIVEQNTKNGKKPEFKERVKLTWRCYVSVITSTGVTVILILTSDKLWRDKYLTAAAVAEVTKKAYDDYREEIRQEVGEEEEADIYREATEKTVNSVGTYFDERFLARCGWGNSLFIESSTGQIIVGNKESIKEVFNNLNYQMTHGYGDPEVSLSDLCSEFGLRYVSGASNRGWNANYTGMIEPKFDQVLLINGDPDLPATVINYYQEPMDNFGRDMFV